MYKNEWMAKLQLHHNFNPDKWSELLLVGGLLLPLLSFIRSRFEMTIFRVSFSIYWISAFDVISNWGVLSLFILCGEWWRDSPIISTGWPVSSRTACPRETIVDTARKTAEFFKFSSRHIPRTIHSHWPLCADFCVWLVCSTQTHGEQFFSKQFSNLFDVYRMNRGNPKIQFERSVRKIRQGEMLIFILAKRNGYEKSEKLKAKTGFFNCSTHNRLPT